ncbi:MAG: hypothetical protein LUI12_00595 [Clostridiales bacterium]|nr:hypothetical protein [Clostridiales bacterium]
MAFIGIVILGIILLVLGIGIFLSIVFFILAIGRKVRKRKASGAFMILGILCMSPAILCVALYSLIQMISTVTLYDGSKAVISSKKELEFYELIKKDTVTDSDLEAIEELLLDTPNLIYCLDANLNGMIDFGLSKGDYDLVEMALKYGAVFDDARKYEHTGTNNSMEFYLDEMIGRTLTSGDIDILNRMFENNAAMEFGGKGYYYSNYFGMACWNVLYNDETVTDAELEFVKVFLNNGFYNDEGFVLCEDIPDNHYFGDNYHFDVIKDANYYELVSLITR